MAPFKRRRGPVRNRFRRRLVAKSRKYRPNMGKRYYAAYRRINRGLYWSSRSNRGSRNPNTTTRLTRQYLPTHQTLPDRSFTAIKFRDYAPLNGTSGSTFTEARTIFANTIAGTIANATPVFAGAVDLGRQYQAYRVSSCKLRLKIWNVSVANDLMICIIPTTSVSPPTFFGVGTEEIVVQYPRAKFCLVLRQAQNIGSVKTMTYFMTTKKMFPNTTEADSGFNGLMSASIGSITSPTLGWYFHCILMQPDGTTIPTTSQVRLETEVTCYTRFFNPRTTVQ